MNFAKVLGFAAAAVLALMAWAGAASATTLETKGVAENAAITTRWSLEGFSISWNDTGGFFANSCTASNIEGTTTTFTGATVSGPLKSWTFSSCTEEPVVVDAPGSFTVTNIAGTTNGTVRSIGTKVTSPSPFGALTCVTAASPGTDIGTLTGAKEGSATLDLTAVLNCGFFAPSVHVQASFRLTSPANLGVGA